MTVLTALNKFRATNNREKMVLSLYKYKLSSELIKEAVIVYTHWVCIGGYTLIKDWKTLLLIVVINVGLKLFTMAWLETPCVTTDFWKYFCRGGGGECERINDAGVAQQWLG